MIFLKLVQMFLTKPARNPKIGMYSKTFFIIAHTDVEL